MGKNGVLRGVGGGREYRIRTQNTPDKKIVDFFIHKIDERTSEFILCYLLHYEYVCICGVQIGGILGSDAVLTTCILVREDNSWRSPRHNTETTESIMRSIAKQSIGSITPHTFSQKISHNILQNILFHKNTILIGNK